jgi:sirohydrochlorin cobaltochelatase
MTRGLLLFAHGARDPSWSAPFDDVAARIRRRRPDIALELAFLEFMAPTLAEAGARLAAAGCDAVDVVPLFLGTGGHVRKDLPVLLDAMRAAHPGTAWQLHPAIGEVDAVVEAMAWAALQVAGDAGGSGA